MSGIHRAPLRLPPSPLAPNLLNACPLSGPQVLHLYCDTCSVPICRECTMGRHGGHSFIYLQEALQDSRALTIQLLADAQQGRQAIQVSPPLSLSFLARETCPTPSQMACVGYWAGSGVWGPGNNDPPSSCDLHAAVIPWGGGGFTKRDVAKVD